MELEVNKRWCCKYPLSQLHSPTSTRYAIVVHNKPRERPDNALQSYGFIGNEHNPEILKAIYVSCDGRRVSELSSEGEVKFHVHKHLNVSVRWDIICLATKLSKSY